MPLRLQKGVTALMLAAAFGRVASVRELVGQGAKLNLRDSVRYRIRSFFAGGLVCAHTHCIVVAPSQPIASSVTSFRA